MGIVALASSQTAVLFALGLALIVVGLLGVGIQVGGIEIKLIDRLNVRKSVMAVGLGLISLTASWVNSSIIPVVGAAAADGIAFLAWLTWSHWFVPSENDDGLTTLRKLGRRFLKTNRPSTILDVGGTTWHLWELQRYREKRPVWVAPSITVEWQEGASEDLRTRVEDKLQQGDDPRGLARLLQTGLQCEALAVTWAPGPGGPGRPHRASVEEIRSRGNSGSIVRQE